MGAVLGHPLVVLLIGALLTGLLIPRLTQRWQDQRKALETKADLIERVSRAVAEIFVATQFAHVGATTQSQERFDDAYRAWQQEKVVLTSLLRAYFRSEELDQRWLRCRAVATAYYVQIGIADPDRRAGYLRTVSAGLVAQPSRDLSEWVDPGTPDLEVAVEADLTDVMQLRNEVWRYLDLTVAALRDSPIRS